MYVRITTLTGASNIAAAVDYIEKKGRPAVEAMTGHCGLGVVKDDAAGALLIAAYWDTAERIESSAGTVSKMRDTIRDLAGAGEVSVEVFEAAVTKRWSIPPSGAVARVLRVESDPSETDAAIAFWADVALPATAGHAGICSAQLLIDRATGKGISVTGWNTQEDLDAALPALSALREQALAAVPSAQVTGVEQYTIVSTTAQLNT